MSEPERQTDVAKLVLIVSSEEAQRLVATWRRAWEEWGDRLGADGQPGSDDLEFLEAWGLIADVDIDDVLRLVPVLFHNEICRPEGAVDEAAINYVRARMLDLLSRPPR